MDVWALSPGLGIEAKEAELKILGVFKTETSEAEVKTDRKRGFWFSKIVQFFRNLDEKRMMV